MRPIRVGEIAWGELQCYEHPDGLILGRKFEILPTGSMLGGVLSGVIGIPGTMNGEDSMLVHAGDAPLIYASGRNDVNALKPHQEAILVGFMELGPWNDALTT